MQRGNAQPESVTWREADLVKQDAALVVPAIFKRGLFTRGLEGGEALHHGSSVGCEPGARSKTYSTCGCVRLRKKLQHMRMRALEQDLRS